MVTTPQYYAEEEEAVSEADKSSSLSGFPKKVKSGTLGFLSLVESPGMSGRIAVCFQQDVPLN